MLSDANTTVLYAPEDLHSNCSGISSNAACEADDGILKIVFIFFWHCYHHDHPECDHIGMLEIYESIHTESLNTYQYASSRSL